MDNHAGNSYLNIKIKKEYHTLNVDWTLTSKGFKLGYLAGMIDGEGMVSVVTCHSKGRGAKGQIGLKPQVSIYNTNRLIIERCATFLHDLEIPCHVMVSNPKRARTIYKTLYRIDMQGMKRARKILKYIIPFLAGKKEAAELSLQFIESRLSKPMVWGNQDRKYDEYELSLVEKIRELNRRGKDKRVLNDYEQNGKTDDIV